MVTSFSRLVLAFKAGTWQFGVNPPYRTLTSVRWVIANIMRCKKQNIMQRKKQNIVMCKRQNKIKCKNQTKFSVSARSCVKQRKALR